MADFELDVEALPLSGRYIQAVPHILFEPGRFRFDAIGSGSEERNRIQPIRAGGGCGTAASRHERHGDLGQGNSGVLRIRNASRNGSTELLGKSGSRQKTEDGAKSDATKHAINSFAM